MSIFIEDKKKILKVLLDIKSGKIYVKGSYVGICSTIWFNSTGNKYLF